MYLLFLPGRTGQDANYLREVGLPELVGASPEFLTLDRGPGGEPGSLVRFGNTLRPDLTPSWDMAGYEWQPIDTATGRHGEEANDDRPIASSPSRLFVGKPKGRPITPEALARKRLRSGPLLTLADGQQWQIPIARQLPRVLGLGRSRPTDNYKPFWDLALKAVEEWLHLGDRGPYWQIGDKDLFAFACAALAINYRLAPPLVDWLGLVDTDAAHEIVEAATEGQHLGRLLALQKKRAEDSASPLPLSDDTLSTSAGAPA